MNSDNNGGSHEAPPARRFGNRPMLSIFLFQSALLLLAILLALIFGLKPWSEIRVSAGAIGVSVAVTLPLLAAMLLLGRAPWNWVSEIEGILRSFLLPLVRNAGPGGIVLISLLAGVGEELLFRGVLQAGLASPLGAITALVITSLAFGLVHYVTRAYFVVATLMGAYLGLLYLWTGNLLVPILVHALYDWAALRYLLWRHSE